MMFDGLGSSASHIKGGRIKALMVSGPKRNPAFPDVPCAAEVGLPDYTATTGPYTHLTLPTTPHV